MIGVYILKSVKDGKQYIGSSRDIEKRLKEHNDGKVESTKFRRPMLLIAYRITDTVEAAAVQEKKYKRSHGALERAIRQGLFNGV